METGSGEGYVVVARRRKAGAVRAVLLASAWMLAGMPLAYGVDFFGLPRAPGVAERTSPWFGQYNQEHFDHTAGEGWIRHREHGWLYVSGTGFGQGFWMWDHIWERWWWTRRDVYPFLFHDETEKWWYYRTGGELRGRAFHEFENGNPGSWITVGFFGMEPDPFAEGNETHWFGEFEDDDFDYVEKRGWIEHAEHGRLYATGRNFEKGIWLYDEILEEWLWTRAEIYPFLFGDDRGNWLYYRRGGESQLRRFFDYGLGEAGEWIEVAE